MPEAGWTEAQVREMLRNDDFFYQDIELPYGLSTGGHDRSSTLAKIFPENLEGKSVLDVGSNYGYFCFEALKRGASRVVGLEVDPESLRKARLLADCKGAHVTFKHLDVETDPLDEVFDYVLCLNILHHMKNPIAVLDKLIALTRERLVLEVANLGRHDRSKTGTTFAQQYFLNRSPVIFVNRSVTFGRKKTQKFYMTPSAVENLLGCHRNMFARVDTMPTEHKDRFITVAHKRRIGRLIVVSGANASGKSTLVEKLRTGAAPEVARRLGIEDPGAWTYLDASHLASARDPSIERAVFHYDFMRPYQRSAQVVQRDEAMDILDTAEEVTFLTLWTPQQVLQERHSRRWTKGGVFRGPKRQKIIRRDYGDPAKVREHYRKWFAYTRTRPGEHVVVSLCDGVRFDTPDEWERRTATIVEGAVSEDFALPRHERA